MLTGSGRFMDATAEVALDGGFASKANWPRQRAKDQDVCFAKKRGLEVEQMCRSQWVYNRLRRFRAGVESISPGSSALWL